MSLKRILILSLLTVCVVLALAITSVLLLLNTTSGARLLVSRITSMANEQPGLELSVNAVSGSIANTLSLSDITFTYADNMTVTTGQLEINASIWALLASRTLHVHQLHISNLDVTTVPSDNEAGNPPDIDAILQSLFRLPVSVSVEEFSLQNLVFNELSAISAELNGARLSEEGLYLEGLALDMNPYALELSGFSLSPDLSVEGLLDWQADLLEGGLSGQLKIAGQVNNLDIEHELQSPLAVNSSGQLQALASLSPEFSLEHSTTVPAGFMGIPEQLQDIELQMITSGNPENINVVVNGSTSVDEIGSLDATLQAGWSAESNEVVISQLEIDRAGDQLSLTGVVSPEPFWQVDADWQVETTNNLALPADIVLNSISGEGSMTLALSESGGLPELDLTVSALNGMLNQYQLSVDGEVVLADSALQRINMNLVQQANSLQVTGDRSTGEEIRFSFEVPSLQALLPEARGQLMGSGLLSGSVDDPTLNASLSMSGLAYPELSLSLEQLDSQLVYEGAEALELSLSARALSYAPLTEDIDSIDLNLDGSPENHSIDLQVDSSMANITLSGSGQLLESDYQLTLDTAQLMSIYGDWELEDSVSVGYISGDLSVSSHCWQYSSLEACLSMEKPATSMPVADFSLAGLPLEWLIRQNENLPQELSEILLHAPQKPDGISELQRTNQLWLPQNAFMEGSLSLSGSIEPGTNDDLNISLMLDAGTLVAGFARTEDNSDDLLVNELNRFEIRYEALSFTRTNGDMSADFRVDVMRDSVDSGLAQGTFDGLVTMSSNQQLGGSVNFDFPELAWTESLVSVLEQPTGELGGQVQFEGTLEQPRLITDITLDNGSTLLPEYGLDLQNIQSSITSDSNNNFNFTVSGISGEGNFRIEGSIVQPFQQSRSLELSIEGDNVEAFNTDTARVVISPQLNAELSSSALLLNGNVHIPTMLLTLDEEIGGNSKTSVSSDVMVQNAEQDDNLRMAEDNTTIMRIPMNGTVGVSLGDDVRFTGYGLSMSLAGGVDLEKTPERPLLANGELTVTEGSYEFYGQKLTTENGHLLFIGNPSNPALDVRATRSVDDITVGMQISGTLSDIQGRLFSSPTLPESEILAMLITGKSLSGVNSQEGSNMLAAIARFGIDKGQGLTGTVQDKLGLDALELNTGRELSDSSVGLGKYLTPDLYMSYKIGLFDNESVLSLDYTLTDRLKLEVETGISQSVDLTYTVEK